MTHHVAATEISVQPVQDRCLGRGDDQIVRAVLVPIEAELRQRGDAFGVRPYERGQVRVAVLVIQAVYGLLENPLRDQPRRIATDIGSQTAAIRPAGRLAWFAEDAVTILRSVRGVAGWLHLDGGRR